MVTKKNVMSIMSFLSYKHLFVQSWKFTFGSYVGNWRRDPYDSSDEKWCTSLNVPIATWRARESSFRVDIGNLIHDSFTIGDMVHDEHRRKVEEIE
jgi:hypothetical protein